MKAGDLVLANGKIYEYVRWVDEHKLHEGVIVEIDEEGILTNTYIPNYFTSEELENNQATFTEDQWYGIVSHIIRQNHDVTEEEIAEATEDIVGRCFIINMPEFNELEEYIACYMDR